MGWRVVEGRPGHALLVAGGRGLGDDPRWWRPAGARDEHGAMTRGREGAGKVKGGRGEEGLPGFWRSPGSF